MDRNAFRAQPFDEGDDAVAAPRREHVVVVVEQDRVRVGGMRILERFFDVVVADDLPPGGVAHRPVFLNALVDDVPRRHAALVAADDGVDVRLHALEQQFPRGRVALGILEHPVRGLLVPDQRVPGQVNAVPVRELDESVGGLPVPLALGRVDAFPFHRIRMPRNRCRHS
ncbi:MAG: hypothetical protein P8X98_07075 [Woeseiaceae bacterium]